MLFIERDHMIEDFAATRSYPPFGNAVLPGRLHARPFGFRGNASQHQPRRAVAKRATCGASVENGNGESRVTPPLHSACVGASSAKGCRPVPRGGPDWERRSARRPRASTPSPGPALSASTRPGGCQRCALNPPELIYLTSDEVYTWPQSAWGSDRS